MFRNLSLKFEFKAYLWSVVTDEHLTQFAVLVGIAAASANINAMLTLSWNLHPFNLKQQVLCCLKQGLKVVFTDQGSGYCAYVV